MKLSLFYQNVTVLDYAYWDNDLGPQGNSYIVNVEFFGKCDKHGILYDFSFAKNKVKEIIDRQCDHRMIIPKGSVSYKGNRGFISKMIENYNNQLFEYSAPEDAFCEVIDSVVNKDSLIALIKNRVMNEMPKNIENIELELLEEKNCDGSIFFNYTHGLKEHLGNCQRLFHGHKNTIKVLVDNKRRKDLEKRLVEDYLLGGAKTVHFVYWENVVNKKELLKIISEDGPINKVGGKYKNLPSVQIKYRGTQGEFQASLPGDLAFFIPIESTVENLSRYFADIVRGMVDKNNQVTVHAFEGIGKGAIVNSDN